MIYVAIASLIVAATFWVIAADLNKKVQFLKAEINIREEYEDFLAGRWPSINPPPSISDYLYQHRRATNRRVNDYV